MWALPVCGNIKREEKKEVIKRERERERKIVKRCWTDQCGIREKRVNQTGDLFVVEEEEEEEEMWCGVVVEHCYVHESASERSRGPLWWEEEKVTRHTCYCVPPSASLSATDRCTLSDDLSFVRSFVCVVVVVVVVMNHDYPLWQSSPVRPIPCGGDVVCCDSHSH